MNKDLILRENLALQRTTLANQSTLLAFLRTSLYFSLAGLSLENLLKIKHHEKVQVLMFGISIFIFIYGVSNYFIHKKRIKRSEIHIGHYKEDYESES